MSSPTPAPDPQPRWLRSAVPDPGSLSSEDAASRISAFVYGNILVMAALIALHPDDLSGFRGIAYVLGTAVSTYIAHVIAESVGLGVRTGVRPSRETIFHELSDSRPIADTAVVPALLMTASLLGWLDNTIGLQLAIAVTVLRIASLGWVVARYRGERTSLRPFLSGVFLAVICVVAAVLKWTLTH